MINIANFLITRRCNLTCDYCRLSGELDYVIKPKEYPNSKYYYENEKDCEWWIDIARKLKKQNPNVFIIIYGGEPVLYKRLTILLNGLNNLKVGYTVISNSKDRKTILDIFDDMVIKGWTGSVDPGFWLDNAIKDKSELEKSKMSFELLKELKKKYPNTDYVAEITCDNNNIEYLESTIKRLSDEGIYSDVTLLDIAKNNYYDFSNITNEINLVTYDKAKREFDKILNRVSLLVHMKHTLLTEMLKIIPANLDCKLGSNNIHNITIDSDGELRLCLRIRGRFVPTIISEEYFTEMHLAALGHAIDADKSSLCKGCNWTCALMSGMDSNAVLKHF